MDKDETVSGATDGERSSTAGDPKGSCFTSPLAESSEFDSLFPELVQDNVLPAFVRGGGGGARMKNFPHPHAALLQYLLCPFLGEIADAYDPRRPDMFDTLEQCAVAGIQQEQPFYAFQLVGGNVPAVGVEK